MQTRSPLEDFGLEPVILMVLTYCAMESKSFAEKLCQEEKFMDLRAWNFEANTEMCLRGRVIAL